MQVGLRESMRNEWSGDIDLGNGDLQQRHGEYVKYLQFVRGIGVNQRKAYAVIKSDLEEQLRNMRDEKEFLTAGLTKAKDCYESKRKLLNISEDSLFALAWDVEDYSKLIEKNTTVLDGINDILARINGPVQGRGNIQADVSMMKKELEPYIKGVTTKKREAASHLLLFMISDELRNFKPYAVPVRVIKYKSITDAMLREFKEELRKAMKECDMTTVGMYKADFFKSKMGCTFLQYGCYMY